MPLPSFRMVAICVRDSLLICSCQRLMRSTKSSMAFNRRATRTSFRVQMTTNTVRHGRSARRGEKKEIFRVVVRLAAANRRSLR